MTALVSILVPCFNAAPWLSATLESALAQTHPRLEIIVIDDGSTDDSLALARRFEPRGVRVVAQPNGGASSARNHGLRLAQGEFIQFLDADDLISADKIAAQVKLLSQAGHDHLASCRWGRFTEDPADAAFVDGAVFKDLTPMAFMLLHVGEGCMMHPSAWLVPRGLIDHAGIWDERLSLNDDGEYFARVVLASRHIVYSSAGESFYRSGLPGSLSRQRSRRALESVALSVELIAAHVLAAENSPRTQRALADYWQRLVYGLYPDAPDLCARAEAKVRSLGGSALAPEAGAREQLVARLVGWKFARRIRRAIS